MDRRYDFDWVRAFGAVMVVVARSAWYALARRSNRRYLRERLLQLGLPLLA